ncbi:DUF1738 domain-containing protein [bacterium]|nr:DUF1738 domain-containing protein [bacterium]MBU1994123.1 DUF1738 domain-containing protein [bacterium]
MANNITQDKMNEIVQKVITSIDKNETGIWNKCWIGSNLPQNFKTQIAYSGFNTLTLMFMQSEMGFSSNQWLTFNQVKFIKGAKLKKGSTSTPIFFFKMLEREEIVEGKKEKKSIPLLKFYYVFNTDQEEGINISTEKPQNVELNKFVSNCNVEIKTNHTAFYTPKNDYIGMPDLKLFKSSEAYAATLLHELAHSTGHSSRLDRDMTGEFASEAYSFEECVAELSSMFLMSHLNIQNETKNSEAYIKGWLVDGLKADTKLLWRIASKANKAFQYILEQQEQAA